tara:strand:+ start:426 stop:554 length:129 start_codon:yes stop_codon:yes gene_type:complete
VVVETQDQDQVDLQEMVKLELLTLVVVVAVDQEVLQEQTLVN